jgi:hypothetical protein
MHGMVDVVQCNNVFVDLRRFERDGKCIDGGKDQAAKDNFAGAFFSPALKAAM